MIFDLPTIIPPYRRQAWSRGILQAPLIAVNGDTDPDAHVPRIAGNSPIVGASRDDSERDTGSIEVESRCPLHVAR
jgi:hypothetical protein